MEKRSPSSAFGLDADRPTARAYASSLLALVANPGHVQTLNFTHATLPIGSEESTVCLVRLRLGQQFANASWLAFADVDFEIIDRKTKAGTDRCVAVLGIDGRSQFSNCDAALEQIEVRNLAFREATEPSCISQPRATRFLDVVIESRFAHANTERSALRAVRFAVEFWFTDKCLVHRCTLAFPG